MGYLEDVYVLTNEVRPKVADNVTQASALRRAINSMLKDHARECDENLITTAKDNRQKIPTCPNCGTNIYVLGRKTGIFTEHLCVYCGKVIDVERVK